ncbi:dihydropteroate synthase [Deferrisoma camini]|uniref:dihydropteroate synthase n=1 Tax=Deferrisoma camini TaxID=1035120 RepID=UPI00046D0227|nr:dihydropteroate synthase [Deferrisoma camini]
MKIFTIAESINIMSKTIGPAIREKDKGPIQKMAEEELAAGADMLDLNLGPARKAGDEMMRWLVETVQEVKKDVRLALDTTNTAAVEAGLQVCNERALINSISAQPQSMQERLPLVKKYDADFVALTMSEEGIPRDSSERAVALTTIMAMGDELGIDHARYWVDPIVLPVSVDINQVKAYMEFLPMVKDILPGATNTCGLSNVSNGAPNELRPILNRVYLMMLYHLGQESAIVDSYDAEMMAICRGERMDQVEYVGKLMNGEDVQPTNDTEKMLYKTFKVLNGDVLYSHSWLED